MLIKCSTGRVGTGVRLGCIVGASVGGRFVSVGRIGVGGLEGTVAVPSFCVLIGAGVFSTGRANGVDRLLSQANIPTRRAINMTIILGRVDLLIVGV